METTVSNDLGSSEEKPVSFKETCKNLDISKPFIGNFPADVLLNELVPNEYKRSKLNGLLSPTSLFTIGSCRKMKADKRFSALKRFLDQFRSGGAYAKRVLDASSDKDFVVEFNTKKGKSTKRVISALSFFSIHESSTQVHFIGVRASDRRKGLGTFVVGVVEAFSESVKGINSTVCQLWDDNYYSIEKPFWESLFFYKVDHATFSGDRNLDSSSTFMVSSGPQKVVSGNWLTCVDSEDMSFLEKTVKSGSDIFLAHVPPDLPPEHRALFSDVEKLICKRFADASDFTVDHNCQVELPNLPVPHDINDANYVESRFGQSDKTSKTWCAGDEIVESAFGPPLFESNKIKILDKGQGKVYATGEKNPYNKIDEHDCLFRHLSFAFSNTAKNSMLLRRFLSYVNRCLGLLPESHSFFEKLPSLEYAFFSIYLLDHMSRVIAFLDQYDDERRDHLKSNVLNVQWKDSEDWFSEEGLDVQKKRNVFPVVAKCYLYKTFEGNIGDISFLKYVLGIDVKLFEASTDGRPHDDVEPFRMWNLRLISCPSPIPFIQPKFNWTRSPYYVCRVIGTHFVLLSTNEGVKEGIVTAASPTVNQQREDHSIPPEPVVNDNSNEVLEKIDSWLEWREHKAFPDPKDRVDKENFQNVGPSFTLTDYMKSYGSVPNEVLMVMARILDPLKIWIDPNYICPLSDSTDIRSFVRLRPMSYLDDVVLELYVKNILAPLNEDFFLVTPATLSTWRLNEVVTHQVTERLFTCSNVVLLNYTHGNHWSVVCIRWGKERCLQNVSQHPLSVHLADSMNDDLVEWSSQRAKDWLSVDVKRFIHHFLLTPLLKGMEHTASTSLDDLDGSFETYVTLHRPSGVILQSNPYDCGVCSMMYLEKFLKTTLLTQSDGTTKTFKFQAPFDDPTMYRLKMFNALILFRGSEFFDPCLTKEYDIEKTPLKSRCTNPSGMSTIEILSQKEESKLPLCLDDKFNANEVSPLCNTDSASFLLLNNDAPVSLPSFEGVEPTVRMDSVPEESQNVPIDSTTSIPNSQNKCPQDVVMADISIADRAILKDCPEETLESDTSNLESHQDPQKENDAKTLLPKEACDGPKVAEVNTKPECAKAMPQETTDGSGTQASTQLSTSSDQDGDDDTASVNSAGPTRSSASSSAQSKPSRRIKIPRDKVACTVQQNVDTTDATTEETRQDPNNLTEARKTLRIEKQPRTRLKTSTTKTDNDPNNLTKPREPIVPMKVPKAKYKKKPKAQTAPPPSSPDPPRRDPNKVTSPSLDNVPRKQKRRIKPTQFFHKDSQYFPCEGFSYKPDDSDIDDPVPLPEGIPRFASSLQDHQVSIAKAGYVSMKLGKSLGFPTEITDDRIPLPNTLKGIKKLSDDLEDSDIEEMIDDTKYLRKKGVNHLHYRRSKKPDNDLLYDPSQRDMDTAQKFARIEYEDTLTLAKQRLCNDIDKVYKNKKSNNEQFPKDVFVRWMNGRAAVNMVEEQMSYHTFFHPSDSIIAVGKLPGNGDQFKVIVKHPEKRHERGEMIVGMDFMYYFFELDFVRLVINQRKYSNMFSWNLSRNEVKQVRTQHLLKHIDKIPPLYTPKDDEERDGIMSIRAMFLFDLFGAEHDVRWSIACEDECKNQGYKYRPISKVYLLECVHPEVIEKFETSVHDLFSRELEQGGFIHEEHKFDAGDKDDRVLEARRKFNPKRQIPYYKTMTKNSDGYYPYLAGTETTQLSGIRYNRKDQTFYGFVELPDSTQKSEVLDRDWVEENVDPEIVEYLQNLDPDRTSFVRIPPGDSIEIPSHLVPDDTPKLRYRQGDDNLDGTCVFSSLCSVLSHLGFEKSARQVNMEKKDFFASDGCDKVCIDRIKHVTEFLMSHPGCKEFPRAGYRCIKLTPTFDLLNQTFESGEFALVLLWDADGQTSHVVCVMKGLVFDSNATHALHFSKESLDACSGGSFCRVRSGRYFHKQQSKSSVNIKKLEMTKVSASCSARKIQNTI